MKIQILSDLHLEFQDYQYRSSDADVIVLAGDIHTKLRGIEWAIENIQQKTVIYVLGNHEFYGAAYPKLISEARAKAHGTNVHLLENNHTTVDGVNFLGATLWTDFNLYNNPRISGSHCQAAMNDYRKIRRSPSYSKLRSIDTALIHKESIRFLSETLSSLADQTNVVLSHHAPSLMSLPDIFNDDPVTPAYVSNLEKFISEHDIDLWIHGHCHHSSDYMVSNTRVVANPRGYADENNDFSHNKIIELKR